MKRDDQDFAVPVVQDHARQRLLQLRQRQRLEATSGAVIARRLASSSSRLSFGQEGLWFLDRMEGPSGVYNSAFAVRIGGALDVAVLERSLQALVARHESLRTGFEAHADESVQEVRAIEAVVARMRLEVETLTPGVSAQPGCGLDKWLRTVAMEPFDLTRAPLLRARLLRLRTDEHVLVLVVHHIVFDGWSKGVLTRDLSVLYASGGDAAALLPLPIQYADYTAWQRERLEGAELDRQSTYWRRQLDGLEPLALPTDRPRPAQISYNGAVEHFVLDASLLTRLKDLAQREDATLFMLLLAAFQVLLMRHSRQLDLAVGVPVAGRQRSELEGLIGYFVNTLVMRTDLSGDPGFSELLSRVRQTALDAYAHQELPFDQLVATLSPRRDLSRHPLYQVSFALNNQPANALVLSGLDVATLELPGTTAKFDLSLALTPAEGVLQGQIEYSTDLFDAASIVRLATQFRHLLDAIVADPTRPIGRLALLSPHELRQILVEWNDTEVAYPHPPILHQLVEAQVRRTPQAVAVVFDGVATSYAELNARANRLAHYLRGCGARPEVPVGLCVDRSLDTLVAVLGILKSGAAYVPLDPDYPEERLAFMLRDCAAPIVVTQRSLRERLGRCSPRGTRLLCFDADGSALAAQPDEDPEALTRAEDLAYVIYTSGSTGEPKGVQIEHRGIGNHLRWLTGVVQVQPSDRFLFATSICFDASIVELFAPLVRGAAVVIASDHGAQDIGALPALIRRHGITVLQMVPSTLRALLAMPSLSQCESLRYLICGGESLDRDLARAARRQLPAATLGNFYGPTEISIDAAWHEIRTIAPGPGPIPIGRPIGNVRCHVLDAHLQPVPIGVIGELCIGGAGLARGYLNRPALTAQRFVDAPFRRGQRLYRSGDLARYLADGTIECIGRLDEQVKLRGFRIELGDIEAALRACPGVTHSAVLLREDRPGLQQLVGYVAGDPAAPGSLRDTLARRLPAHMLPAAIVRVPVWPLLTNGKLDRLALPAPDLAPVHAVQEPPGSQLEEALMRIWSRLLGVQTLSVHDDFFELGGHSLLSIRLLAEIEKVTGSVLRVSALFQAPTIRKLAASIERHDQASASCIVTVQARGTRPRLFGVPGYGGAIGPFKTLADELGSDQPVCVLDVAAFADEKTDFTLEELARRMIADMRLVQPAGPYQLVGYSMGGKIAYEVARQLRRAGDEVALLALLDSAGPGYPKLAPFGIRTWLHLRQAFAMGPAEARRYVVGRLWNLRKYLIRTSPKLLMRISPKGFYADVDVWRSPAKAMQQSANPVHRAWGGYVPTVYPDSVLLVRAEVRTIRVGEIDDIEMGWGPLARGGVRVETVACGHNEMLDPENARVVAALLAKHLAMVEGRSTRIDESACARA